MKKTTNSPAAYELTISQHTCHVKKRRLWLDFDENLYGILKMLCNLILQKLIRI